MNCACCGQTVPWSDVVDFLPESGLMTHGGRQWTLTPVQMRLFQVLWAKPGRVFGRDHLLNFLSNDPLREYLDTKIIDVHFCHIRQRLKDFPFKIVTEKGLGYKLVKG